MRALHRTLVSLLVVLFAILTSGLALPQEAQAAPKAPNYPISPLGKGDPLYLAIMMYRIAHTELTKNDPNPDNKVGYGRNVASGFFVTEQGGTTVQWYVTLANVSWHQETTNVVPVNINQRDPVTGQWKLVDIHGNELTENDSPVRWDQSSKASFVWDLGKEPELAQALERGELDAERLIYEFSKRKMNPALGIQVQDKIKQVGSEKMFCRGPAQCLANLKDTWFKSLEQGKVVTNRPSRGKLKRIAYDKKLKVTDAQRKAATEQLKGNDTSDNEMAERVQEFIDKGKPTGLDAGAILGDGSFADAVGNSGAHGPAAAALAPGGADPGGIDFSTIKLRYLAEDSNGQLRYAYSAAPATGSDSKVTEGKVAATQMSDAFYVWLSLPTSTFWVNLNPTEPDRIVDPKLGTTDVGRILLEADLRMKKLAAQLTNPNTATGKQFWGEPNPNNLQECTITRQWIVPKPASVYEDHGGLYIVDAPLEVKAEAEKLNGKQGDPSCPVPSQRMESVFEQAILPKVEDAVNHSPDFAELRRVYLSRVAAEWYRQRHTGVLANMIDSGDVSRWPALKKWSSRDVFDAYVKSYKEHEYTVTKEFDSGNYHYTFTYTDGGVDFGDVPFTQVPQATFQQQHADLADAVQRSQQRMAPDQHGRVWLGATNDVKPRVLDYAAGDEPEDLAWENREPPAPEPETDWLRSAAGVVVVLLVLTAAVWIVVVHRRRTRSPKAL
jgi:hypothetical protein